MANGMTPEGAAPQQGAQGGEVLKEAAAGIMQQVEAMGKFAQALSQTGMKGPADKILQATQLVQSALEELGVTQQAQGGAVPQSPEAAGTAAQPTNVGR